MPHTENCITLKTDFSKVDRPYSGQNTYTDHFIDKTIHPLTVITAN